MKTKHRKTLTRTFLLLGLVCSIPMAVQAQGRGNGRGNGNGNGHGNGGGGHVEATTTLLGVDVTLTADMRAQIQSYYAAHPVADAQSLPPGIRRNLARGKPLPPGIAKKVAPPELASRVRLRDGYALVEVGLDVFLVEVATNVIHDVLMDVVR